MYRLALLLLLGLPGCFGYYPYNYAFYQPLGFPAAYSAQQQMEDNNAFVNDWLVTHSVGQ